MTVGAKSNLPVPTKRKVEKPSGPPKNLEVLSWAGFRGAVSFTFDDANTSQIANYAALQAAGVRYTFYLQTGKTAEVEDGMWRTALADGHELGNHTRAHASEDDGSDTDAATRFIEDTFGVAVYTMAAPNGSGAYRGIARSRFIANRGVANALVKPNDDTDPFQLPCYLPPENAKAGTMNAELDSAESLGGWRIMLIHGFNGGSDGAYRPVALTEFVSTVHYAKTKNLWIDSLVNVVAYWRAEKAFLASKPRKSGQETTYTWTLPDHFPPGMFLRVTADGGTLRQGDAKLTWDENGYYEISLDALSLTLSP
jgi:peptidoglycan/xylan/chitin deacetylase (PgdA/CDA1 family)